MTCEACTTAAANPRSGLYRVGCPECGARMLAQGPDFFVAASKERITPEYRVALATILAPGESIESAHKRVRAWAERIRDPRPAAVEAGLKLDPFAEEGAECDSTEKTQPRPVEQP